MSADPGVLNSLLRRKKFDLPHPLYWQLHGHDSRYIAAMDDLQSALINYVRRPSRTVMLQPVGGALSDVRLRHDELLCKLWKYLAIALIHRQDCDVDSFRVARVQLVPSVMAQLGRALRSKNIKSLTLVDNDFGGEGALFAAEVLGGNPSLTSVKMNFNRLNDVGSMVRFGKALGEHPPLASLSLRFCSFGADSATLSALMSGCNNVKFLDLRNTDIGSAGAAIVARFLSRNPRMETLNLSNNNVDEAGADAIARGLKSNDNLKLLYLTGNPITDAGKGALLRSIFDTSTLNAASDSNHACELLFDRMHAAHGMIMLVNNFTAPAGNRRRKIIFAAHDTLVGDEDFRSLEGVPAQLGPDVLEAVQFGSLRYMSSTAMFNYSLTLIFQTMRRWLCCFL